MKQRKPQAGVGVVMMSDWGYELVTNTTSSSMTLNLKSWRDVMEAYLDGGFKYYTTLPTDVLSYFRDAAHEIEAFGVEETKRLFIKLGRTMRAMMKRKGLVSVTKMEFEAPGVIVMYTDDDQMIAKLRNKGIQGAAGVPFMLGESLPYTTFRIGLFGMEKIQNIDTTVKTLEDALDSILSERDGVEDL